MKTFIVTVENAAPDLAVTPSTDASFEGTQIGFGGDVQRPGVRQSRLNMAPGLNNGLSETAETFALLDRLGRRRQSVMNRSVTDVERHRRGVPSSGTIDARHTYADDGVYTVKVTVADDDGGAD